MSNEEPKVLEISVSEDVGLKDVPPGTPKQPTFKEREENLPKEEVEKRQKIMLEYTRLSGRYCKPHNTRSRWVTVADMDRVLSDGKDMVAMCNLPRGKYSGGSAIAHPQIDDKDPLRFFVFPDGKVIINPVITDHTKFTTEKIEGCLSFPDEEPKKVMRYNKITVTYQTLQKVDKDSKPIISEPITEKLSGGASHTFQHELSHLNGVQIYDNDFKPESCEGLGDGFLDCEKVKELYK